MASTVYSGRNPSFCGAIQSFMGEIPNYPNNNNSNNINTRHLNANQKRKTKNNKRPIDTQNGFNGAYVTYNVSSCSRSEIYELRMKLASDLERIQSLIDRIRLTNGKLNKFGLSNKHVKHYDVNECDVNLMKDCRQVLNKLMKHKLSWVFNKPVDAIALGLHDYHEIIKRPMDLGSVKLNLLNGLYSSPVNFASDVRLVFGNAMLYNPKTDEVHGMADQLLAHFEMLFRPIQVKLAGCSYVYEFSAVDEDIQSLDRSKKLKTSDSVVSSVLNKQNYSTVVQSPVRMPSPMQSAEREAEPELIKPSSTATRGTVPKLPKPKARDLNKRKMNVEEKQKLGLGLQSMPQEKMPQLLQIIRKRNDKLAQEGDEIELDIEALDTETLWELDRFVANRKKLVSKTKRQALLVSNISADIEEVPSMDAMKKHKKEAGEEDVDIGDEMSESSFPHMEIDKDDGRAQGQAVGDGNASSSSSGSSSSSSGDSSSASDSDSGSDSDADEAQS